MLKNGHTIYAVFARLGEQLGDGRGRRRAQEVPPATTPGLGLICLATGMIPRSTGEHEFPIQSIGVAPLGDYVNLCWPCAEETCDPAMDNRPPTGDADNVMPAAPVVVRRVAPRWEPDSSAASAAPYGRVSAGTDLGWGAVLPGLQPGLRAGHDGRYS